MPPFLRLLARARAVEQAAGGKARPGDGTNILVAQDLTPILHFDIHLKLCFVVKDNLSLSVSRQFLSSGVWAVFPRD